MIEDLRCECARDGRSEGGGFRGSRQLACLSCLRDRGVWVYGTPGARRRHGARRSRGNAPWMRAEPRAGARESPRPHKATPRSRSKRSLRTIDRQRSRRAASARTSSGGHRAPRGAREDPEPRSTTPRVAPSRPWTPSSRWRSPCVFLLPSQRSPITPTPSLRTPPPHAPTPRARRESVRAVTALISRARTRLYHGIAKPPTLASWGARGRALSGARELKPLSCLFFLLSRSAPFEHEEQLGKGTHATTECAC